MRRVLAASAAVLLLVAGCSSDDGDDDQNTEPEPTPFPTATGFRTESFGDVEMSVPNNWGHQTGDVAAALWCISDAAVSLPVVIRPGVPVESTCPGPEGDEPDPATLMIKAGQFVSMVFAESDPDAEEGTEGDRVTTKLGHVLVRIQAPSSVRTQILGTLKQITTDASGCPVSDPIANAPARRPDTPVSVVELKGVKSVAACRYSVPGGQFANPPDVDDEFDPNDPEASEDPNIDEGDVTVDDEDPLPDDFDDQISDIPSIDPDAALQPTIAPLLPSGTSKTAPTLLSSVLLTSDAARDAIHGIAESKVGSGPNSDGGCEGSANDDVRGTEEIVLRVTTATGNSQIYLRYGGCHNGFDDGLTERALTRSAVAPFVSDANLVPAYGEEMSRILDDPDAPATSGHTEEDQAGGTAPPSSEPSASSEPTSSSEPGTDPDS